MSSLQVVQSKFNKFIFRGIGKHMCEEILKDGAKNLVLVSRSKQKLETTLQELLKIKSENQNIFTISCDVSDKVQVDKVFEFLKEKNITTIDYLYLVHGLSIPKYFVEQDESEFEKQISVNYLGGVYMTKRAVPIMLKNKQDTCHIIFTGSTLSFLSFVGYSSYAPTKYAVRALAEALYNEFQGQNIQVHLACPSDTKTPGFENENLTKPIETKKISETGSIFEPDSVAKSMIDGVKSGEFYLYHDLLTGAVISISKGLGPKASYVIEVLTAPILSIAGIFISLDWNKVTTQHAKEREEKLSVYLKK